MAHTVARRLAAALVVTLLLSVTGTVAASKEIFSIEDPRGDDHGDGTVEYPVVGYLEKGDLDLVRFRALRGKDGTWFEAMFAETVKKAGREAIDAVGTQLDRIARFDVYTLNIDVYIDTDGKPGSGTRFALPGRRASMAEGNEWERVVVMTPRPFEAENHLEREMVRLAKSRMREEQPTIDKEDIDAARRRLAGRIADAVHFSSKIRVRGKKVSFFVPDDFLGGPASPDWGYVVVVTASDLYEELDVGRTVGLGSESEPKLMNLPIGPGRSSSRLGTTRYETGLLPPIVDIVVPAPLRQEDVLSDYDLRTGKQVALPAVVPSGKRPPAPSP